MAQSAHSSDIITLSHLGEHKERRNLWIAVHGKVYDLTVFASDHPGGVDVLVDTAGTDATEPFDYVGHGEDALVTMQKYLVGRLEGSDDTVPQAKKTRGIKNAYSQNKLAVDKIVKVRLPTKTITAATTKILVVGLVLRILRIMWKSNVGSRHGLIALETIWDFQRNTTSDATVEWNSTNAFFGGLILASTLSFVGLGYLYSLFSKTLQHEKDVFTYPSVIPRKAKK